AELAAAMSRYAGVLRDGPGLEHLLGLLAAVPPAADAGPGRRPATLTLETAEATNLHIVSTAIAAAALARTESRGCHRRRDYPQARPGAGQRITLYNRDGQLDLRS